MKKIAALLASALICAYSFAVEKPWLSISAETPKKFFSDVSDIMRKVYPDPQLEMTLALMLSQFGYPNFYGIDPKENFALAAFGKASAPQLFMAVKTSKDSAIYKFAEHAKLRKAEKNGWLVLQLDGNPEAIVSDYADETISAAAKSAYGLSITIRDAKKLLDSIPVPQLPQEKCALEYLENILSQTEEIKTSFGYDGNSIVNQSEFAAKEGTDTAKLINSMSIKKRVDEAAFVPQDYMITALTSLNGAAAAQSYEKMMSPIFKSLNIPESAVKSAVNMVASTTTSAGGLNLQSIAQIQSVNVSESPLSLEEIVKLSESASFDLIKSTAPDSSLKAEMKNESGVNFCEITQTLLPNMPAQKIYIAKEGKYSVTAFSRESLFDAVAKIKNPPSEYPLKKYSAANANIVLIINNAQVIKKIFSIFGVDFDGKIGNTETFGYIEKNSLKFRTSIGIGIIRAYSDILRKIAEINAQNHAGTNQGAPAGK